MVYLPSDRAGQDAHGILKAVGQLLARLNQDQAKYLSLCMTIAAQVRRPPKLCSCVISRSVRKADINVSQMRKVMEQRFMFVHTLEEAEFNRVVSSIS